MGLVDLEQGAGRQVVQELGLVGPSRALAGITLGI